jgi:hypothetical protein
VAVTNAQRVQVALEVVARGLGPYVDARLARLHGKDWPEQVAHAVPRNAKEDPHFLLTTMIRTWREAAFQDALGHSGRSWVGELLDARNAWAHNEASPATRPIARSTRPSCCSTPSAPAS